MFFVRSRKSLFFVPSPDFRIPERAERVKRGPEPRAARPVATDIVMLARTVLSDGYGA
jgi:hypothetical protein